MKARAAPQLILLSLMLFASFTLQKGKVYYYKDNLLNKAAQTNQQTTTTPTTTTTTHSQYPSV